jgi:NitT/TauT family transport system substrate-binding protein
LALAGSTAFAWPTALRAQSRSKVRVAYSAAGESLAHGIYAFEGGFFAKAGIDAELVLVNSSTAIAAGIVSGDLDIGPSNVASMAAAHVRGLPVNLFAPSVIISSSAPPTTIVAVSRSSPIHGPKDLNGKTIGCNAVRDLQQAAVMTWMDKNGGDGSTARFVEIPASDQLEALAANRVDAACLVEPFLSSPDNTTRQVTRPYDSLGHTLMTFGWIANRAWYDGDPHRVADVRAALQAAARWANGNHAATAAIDSRYSRVPVSVLLAENRQLFGDGILDPSVIQPIIDASAHYGFLPHGFAAEELFAKGQPT